MLNAMIAALLCVAIFYQILAAVLLPPCFG
jgi:hypothetical protein